MFNLTSAVRRLSPLLFLMVFQIPSAHAALERTVENGILTGAKNLEFGSLLLNVEFKDGSCNSLLSGCASDTVVPHLSVAAATLLVAVLLDTADGDFDSQPSLIRGCSGAVGPTGVCNIHTFANLLPTPVFVSTAKNFVAPMSVGDSIEFQVISPTEDTTADTSSTWAVWSITQVPEPSTAALLGLGGLTLVLIRRRRR